MTKYREIIRLTGLGFSQRSIMASCGVAQKTVVKVQKRARELNLSWPLDESMTDSELQRLMFSKESSVSKSKRMPDYDYIHKELLRNGVSKKLLWTEYMEDCRANGDEPLMYSQFCYHIQQDEQKRRATMHISRKPGEQVEVDWAGDPATIIDPDTGEILRLSSLGFSNRNIALSVPCSRNTVAKVLKRAQELDISWPLEDNQTVEVLEGLFYPKQRDRSQKRMP